MSFLSKRSRSQRSFTRGSEEISVRRLGPGNELAKCREDNADSDGSSPSNMNATNFALYGSCVSRKFPKHKSSHLRFLAWVAYTRKFTDEPITEDERRTSKRIFSKLGSKRNRTSTIPEPEPDMSIAKYVEKSNTLEHHPDFPTMFDAGPARGFPSQSFQAEDSFGRTFDWRASQELPDTQICEMTGSECPLELGVNAQETWLSHEDYAEPDHIWLNPGPACKVPIPTQKKRGSLDMLPPLNTQLCNLNPEPYAFSIAVDHDEIKVHTKEWFNDSLSWVHDLGSERDRVRYSRIARAVWQPVKDVSGDAAPPLYSPDKQNLLYLACQRFLDILESFVITESKPHSDQPPTTSDLAFLKKAQVEVIDELIKAPSIEGFIEDVVKIEARLKRGRIRHVRHLELELMCAGKHCNSLYETSPSRTRAAYRIRDIARIKTLLPEELCYDPSDEEEAAFDMDDDAPLGFSLNVLGRCDRRMGSHMDEFMRDADDVLNESCGDEKWKPSNLRRHKRTQHASADKKGSWVCKWEGCTKSFTRSDNLRSHMRDKGHGIETATNPHAIEEEDEEGHGKQDQDGEERGPKRRKLAVG
ncbi:hypothetical protein M7I_3078 [Glarea lozoyensis 74030]|uniref:C2H2-type domain-containing protein n=1 Tax=Glarea lozoyensis (strain ATCC 74030 / MF5533) TaxID=1104152 RepID=H0EKI0_GLAL7|nr:hypothetical protein M7I_3078 [Glarea lozoyensis 74030]